MGWEIQAYRSQCRSEFLVESSPALGSLVHSSVLSFNWRALLVQSDSSEDGIQHSLLVLLLAVHVILNNSFFLVVLELNKLAIYSHWINTMSNWENIHQYQCPMIHVSFSRHLDWHYINNKSYIWKDRIIYSFIKCVTNLDYCHLFRSINLFGRMMGSVRSLLKLLMANGGACLQSEHSGGRGGWLSVGPAWSTKQAPGQPELL